MIIRAMAQPLHLSRQTSSQSGRSKAAVGPWWPRLAAFALSALAAGCAVYWALKWPTSSLVAVTAATTSMEVVPVDAQVLARALGGNALAPAGAAPSPVALNAATRFALVGTIANGTAVNGNPGSGKPAATSGSALIAIDGKPARPYRVGAKVGDDLVLQAVAPRRAMLAPSLDSPVTVTLEMVKNKM